MQAIIYQCFINLHDGTFKFLVKQAAMQLCSKPVQRNYQVFSKTLIRSARSKG